MLEVYLDEPGPPARDLAFEPWLLERAADGTICVRLWSWPGPVVVIGHGQDASDVDLEWCRAQGIPVLRRITGGTGVIHHGDLAVSLVLPRAHPWARHLLGLYDAFLDVIEPALRAAGGELRRPEAPRRATRVRSPICFEDLLSDTLLRGDRKVVGCAQARRKNAVLVHAVVLLGLDPVLYARVFQVPAERVARNLAPAVAGGNWQEIGRAVVTRLSDALGLECVTREVPELPARFLEPYRTVKWVPVPAGAWNGNAGDWGSV